MRNQSKAIFVGGLFVLLGYVLGSAASDGSVYAQGRSSSIEWAGVKPLQLNSRVTRDDMTVFCRNWNATIR